MILLTLSHKVTKSSPYITGELEGVLGELEGVFTL